MNLDLLRRARDRLKNSTPMCRDCGRYCGAACCAPDEDGQGGVYLFPGEEALIGRWGRLEPARLGSFDAPILTCDGRCDRSLRPFACRFFPLTPVLDETGAVSVRLDCRSRAMCPLNRNGLPGLRQAFVRDVQEAFALLAQDSDYAAFLRAWQALEEEYRAPLF